MSKRIVLRSSDFIAKAELRRAIELLTDLLNDVVDISVYDGFYLVFDQDTGDVWMENDRGETYGEAEED